MKPGDVYQAIKAIRLEMNLPQYNDPSLHGPELTANGMSGENGRSSQGQSASTEEPVPVGAAQTAEEQSTGETPASASEMPEQTPAPEPEAADPAPADVAPSSTPGSDPAATNASHASSAVGEQ